MYLTNGLLILAAAALFAGGEPSSSIIVAPAVASDAVLMNSQASSGCAASLGMTQLSPENEAFLVLSGPVPEIGIRLTPSLSVMSLKYGKNCGWPSMKAALPFTMSLAASSCSRVDASAGTHLWSLSATMGLRAATTFGSVYFIVPSTSFCASPGSRVDTRFVVSMLDVV